MGRRQQPDRTGTPADFVVVGLGNPGAEYDGTRHNVGFEVADLLAQRWGARLRRAPREQALIDEVRRSAPASCRVAIVKPQTYMNASGDAVAPLLRRFGVAGEPHKLVVIHDELDLPVGRMKVKLGGGLAGHNGLRSIKASLHTDDFFRVRIGVGKPASKEQGADHVLKRVGKVERSVLDTMVQHGADAVESLIDLGLDATMQRVNAVDLTGELPGR